MLKLFKGKKQYYQTFKAFAYMSAFGIIGVIINGTKLLFPKLIPLTIIGLIWSIFTVILLGYYFKYYTNLKKWKVISIFLIYFIIVMVIIITMSIFIMGQNNQAIILPPFISFIKEMIYH